MEDVVCNGLRFWSNFDSGNLKSVSYTGVWELTIRKDCDGTEFERKSATWFYFRVQDDREKLRIAKFRLMINKQGALYRNGYKVLAKTSKGWHRTITSYKERDGYGELNFEHTFTQRGDFAEFAFCYPYTYNDCQKKLEEIEKKSSKTIYVHRELLCWSLDKRRIDLVTITSPTNLTKDEEPLPCSRPEDDEDLSWLLPEVRLGNEKRSRVSSSEKMEILVSCRVHPGETPASHMLDGLLDYLMEDEASFLREQYVWRIIPMLNPDGVVRGHYRHDSRGVDLNRVYLPKCDARYYPGAAGLLKMMKNLRLFLDFHAHATKNGVFAYGNDQQVETMLYPLVVSTESKLFDFDACNFDLCKNNRDGCARVGVHRETGLVAAYTIESNYNGSKRLLGQRDDGYLAYTPAAWHLVGRAFGEALRDLDSDDLKGRWKSLDAMRDWLATNIKHRKTRAERKKMLSLVPRRLPSKRWNNNPRPTTSPRGHKLLRPPPPTDLLLKRPLPPPHRNKALLRPTTTVLPLLD